jgi:MraZ protein
MGESEAFILGEFRRTIDDRHRLAIPKPLADALAGQTPEVFLAKERAGCLSLWRAELWRDKLEKRVKLIRDKLELGNLEQQIGQVQLLGRLLSTRHTDVQLDSQGRVLIPKEFREFLGVEPGGEVVVVGAAVCVEIWSPPAWLKYLAKRMPRFRRLFHQLSQ